MDTLQIWKCKWHVVAQWSVMISKKITSDCLSNLLQEKVLKFNWSNWLAQKLKLLWVDALDTRYNKNLSNPKYSEYKFAQYATWGIEFSVKV